MARLVVFFCFLHFLLSSHVPLGKPVQCCLCLSCIKLNMCGHCIMGFAVLTSDIFFAFFFCAFCWIDLFVPFQPFSSMCFVNRKMRRLNKLISWEGTTHCHYGYLRRRKQDTRRRYRHKRVIHFVFFSYKMANYLIEKKFRLNLKSIFNQYYSIPNDKFLNGYRPGATR